MPNRVEITFVFDPDGSGSASVKRAQGELAGLGSTATRTGQQVDAGLGFLKGAVIVEFFRRGTEAAVEFGEKAVEAFNAAQQAGLGLASVATFKGIGGGQAVEAVQSLDLVKNGLLGVGDASLALKNLLAAGFSLPQSIELIKRFGDSAAFGKQAALSFGQAITSATEGIKNGNSTLVDNAGLTKNLSVILKERGFEMQDLSDSVKGAAATEALYQGILKETQGQLGDAAKLSDTFAGSQARLDAAETQLLVTIGEVISKNPELNEGMKDLTGTVIALTKEIGTPGSGMNKALE